MKEIITIAVVALSFQIIPSVRLKQSHLVVTPIERPTVLSRMTFKIVLGLLIDVKNS